MGHNSARRLDFGHDDTGVAHMAEVQGEARQVTTEDESSDRTANDWSTPSGSAERNGHREGSRETPRRDSTASDRETPYVEMGSMPGMPARGAVDSQAGVTVATPGSTPLHNSQDARVSETYEDSLGNQAPRSSPSFTSGRSRRHEGGGIRVPSMDEARARRSTGIAPSHTRSESRRGMTGENPPTLVGPREGEATGLPLGQPMGPIPGEPAYPTGAGPHHLMGTSLPLQGQVAWTGAGPVLLHPLMATSAATGYPSLMGGYGPTRHPLAGAYGGYQQAPIAGMQSTPIRPPLEDWGRLGTRGVVHRA